MKRFLPLIIIVLVVIGGWSAAWMAGAGAVETAVRNLAANDGEAAPRVTCDELGVTGFPFRFDVECTDALIVNEDITTRLAGIRASMMVYNPTQVLASALGPATIEDAFAGTQMRVDFTNGQASARLTARNLIDGLGGAGWRIARVSLAANDVKAVDMLFGDRALWSADIADLQVLDMAERHDSEAGLAALRIVARMAGVGVPELEVSGGEARADIELTGVPDDLRSFDEPDLLQRWQAAGGNVKLTALRADAGEQFLESSGTLGLDSGARLDGQVSVKSKGLVEYVEPMLPPELKPLIIGTPADDGSYSQTINIKAGVVFSGLMPLTIIPPLL